VRACVRARARERCLCVRGVPVCVRACVRARVKVKEEEALCVPQ
jgi:hypothetical protein